MIPVVFKVLLHPQAITILEDYVYWTDRGASKVMRCNKFDGTQNEEVVIAGISQPRDIHSFHPVRQPTGTSILIPIIK